MEHLSKRAKEKLENVIVHGWQIASLKNCGLKEFPKELFDHPDIVSIDLSNDEFCDERNKNQIEEIPDGVAKIKGLKTLKCARTGLKKISPKMGELRNLKELDVIENNLLKLPSEIANMRSLKSIHVEGNKFELLPPEIAARGIESIRNFYKELQEEDYLYEVKLIIVGEGRVGKTCISQALIDPKYSLEKAKSTKGINIKSWTIPKEEIQKINHNIARDFQINIWDFGGQEIYHSTHQFFLTKRSIYLMVTESRKEDNRDDFFYWLNIIKLLGDNSPVMMVLNKCDEPTKDLPIKEFQEAFENIIDFKKISLHDDFRDEFLEFKDRLIKHASDLPHIGSPLPKTWVDVRRDIEELKLQGKNIISRKEYLELCKKHYRDEESAMFLSEYFHDLGVILFFKEDLVLKDVVILNHEWITAGVYKILDDQTVIDNKGKFNLKDLERILDDVDYKFNIREMISLMKNTKFDLCFEIGDGEYLVPRLLPVDEIEFEWPTEGRSTKFEYKYKFMPKGILTRLIVKMNRDISNNTYWRHGVVLEHENTKAFIREKYFEKKITIELIGPYRKEFLSIIRKAFNEIHSDFNKLKVDEMIPCICKHCQVIDKPFYYKYNTLRRFELNKKYEIVCNLSLEDVSVLELTDNIILDEVLASTKVIYCENKNAEVLNLLKLEGVRFHPERDSNGVFVQTKANTNRFGLRDRDYLIDTEIRKLNSLYKNYYILDYYCFENYLYHPENVKELLGHSFNEEDYRNDIIKQKNEKKVTIISNYKQARKGYQEFQVERDNIKDKANELDVANYLESDDIETFFKSFSMKTYYDKTFLSKYMLKEEELAKTNWFKNKLKKKLQLS